MGPQGDMLTNDTGGLLSDIRGNPLNILQHEVRCDLIRHIYVPNREYLQLDLSFTHVRVSMKLQKA